MSNFEPPANDLGLFGFDTGDDDYEPGNEEDDGDPIAVLREQIAAMAEQARRIGKEEQDARDEAAREAGEDEVPPAGWATPDEAASRQQELTALIALVEALRDLVPPELKQQVRDLLRQLLLLLRAVIDWWVERMDDGAPRTGSGPSVEDIPIR